MSPRLERERAMDDMAEFAQHHRFAPIPCPTPDPRGATRHVPAHIAARSEPAVLTLTTPALLAEVDDGLALRVCRRETTARDVLLVQALAERVRALTMRPATNREPLDGALWLDLAAEANHA